LLNPSSPPVLHGSLGVLWRVHLGEDALVLLEAKAMHKLRISANGIESFLVATPRYWDTHRLRMWGKPANVGPYLAALS
jgi:hypothetical protein